MNKKNISPNPQQPVDRVPTGQLPSVLAELNEETLAIGAHPATKCAHKTCCEGVCCSYDGEDE